MTASGPRTLDEENKLNEEVLERDRLTLSPDGETMTVQVSQAGEKQRYVYEKQ